MSTITSPHTPVITGTAATTLRRDLYPNITQGHAVAYLAELAGSARHRTRGRRWARPADVPAGARMLISAAEPDVCLIVERGVVTDVVVRASKHGEVVVADVEARDHSSEKLRRDERRAAARFRERRLSGASRRAGGVLACH